jgi:hypothetical protein
VRFNPVYRARGRWWYQWDGEPIGPFATEDEASCDLRWHIQHPDDYLPEAAWLGEQAYQG